MNTVQFKTDYVVGNTVPAGTIVLHDARLFFAIKETNSTPEDDTAWAEIGEIGTEKEPGMLETLFGATPKAKTPADVNGSSQQRNLATPKALSFDNSQAGGRRRRTTKKPRRK